ncbi:MAG: hypothetical protein HUU25_03735 [Candidatus Sumerlaeia bacterium]|nr:hypothetical protein [Candidatus Sumerlaeia bacterium]
MQLLFTTLEQWFWHVWDNLFRLVMWNVLVALVLLPAQLLPPLPLIAFAVLVAGPVFTGTISWAWPMADDRSPDAAELGRRLVHCWARAAAVHALFAAAAALLRLNLTFYLGERGQAMLGPAGSLLLAGVSLWIGVFVLLVWLWAQVAIAEDRERGPHTVGSALRQGARILLYHPLLSVAHGLVLAGLGWLAVRSQVGVLIGWFSFSAVYLATAVFEMYFASEAKAQAAKEAREPIERRPASWREIIQDETPGAHPGRRPRRSLKELLRPWEM